jgi:hypothetical protein
MPQPPSPLFSHLLDGISLTGSVHKDVPLFLKHHGHSETALHSAQVAAEARRVATYVGENADQAEMAGWLHDCSAIFPAPERVVIARQLRSPGIKRVLHPITMNCWPLLTNRLIVPHLSILNIWSTITPSMVSTPGHVMRISNSHHKFHRRDATISAT